MKGQYIELLKKWNQIKKGVEYDTFTFFYASNFRCDIYLMDGF